MYHIPNQFYRVQPLYARRYAVDGIAAATQRAQIEAYCRQIFQYTFQYGSFRSRQLDNLRKQYPLRYALFLSNLAHIAVEQYPDMCPVLVYQHQTRFNGSQNKTPLELEVLRSFLYRCLIAIERGACPGRNRFLEIRNPLLLSWIRTGNRILCKGSSSIGSFILLAFSKPE